MENKPQLHLMLDVETLSTESNAHLLDIALVAFSPITGRVNEELSRQYVLGGLKTQHQAHVSQSTVAWWMSGSVDQFKTYYDKEREYDHPTAVATDLYHFFRMAAVEFDLRVWCTGTFDIDLLNSFVRRHFNYDRDVIPYWAARDVRTLRDLGVASNKVTHDPKAVSHDAYDDCLRQTDVVCAAYALALFGAKNDGRVTESIGDQGGHSAVSPTAEHNSVADTRTENESAPGADQRSERATENRRWETNEGSASSTSSYTSGDGSDGTSTSE